MATQGLISITENGKVILKAIAGCDGYNAKLLAKHIQERNLRGVDEVYKAALELGFGDEATLVVMDAERMMPEYQGVERLPLYRETFNEPGFNPRWESGMVQDDCLAIIELPPDCSSHNHACLACCVKIEGVACDSPTEDRYCSECKKLSRFERTLLRHLNSIGTFTASTAMDVETILEGLDAIFGIQQEEPQEDTIQ